MVLARNFRRPNLREVLHHKPTGRVLKMKNNDLAVSCLEKAGIDIMKRAEVLTLPELLHLSDVIEDAK